MMDNVKKVNNWTNMYLLVNAFVQINPPPPEICVW
jgi:hypothetical protein